MTRTTRISSRYRRSKHDASHTTRACKSSRRELNYHLSCGMEYSNFRAARRTRKQISQKRTARFQNDVVVQNPNLRRGENGCLEFSDVGSNILALHQLIRGTDPTQLVEETLLGNTGGNRNIVTDLFVELFATRNARGGKGERLLSYQKWFAIKKYYPKTALQMIPLFVHYGYWKDLLQLCVLSQAEEGHMRAATESTTATIDVCLSVMRDQFQKDIEASREFEDNLANATGDRIERKRLLKDGPNISLLAKWLPREGSLFDKELNFVLKFAKMVWPCMNPSSSGLKAKYRKTTSRLAGYLDLPEVLLSIQQADEINFHKLASKATMNLTRAMLNETKFGSVRKPDDAKRIKLSQMFVQHMVKKGLKGSQVYPHEIVHEILNNNGQISKMREMALDAQWKDMVKCVIAAVKEKAEQEGLSFNPCRMIPLSDVSGSMYGIPMEVSIAMGILVSEITHPAFQNMVLTFESYPRWHILNPMDSIVKRVRSLASAPWGGSTNFAGAFDKILKVCEQHKLTYEDLPSLVVFSDMQFDVASPKSTDTMLQTMETKLLKTAKRLGWGETILKPLIFWNLRDTCRYPATKDSEGVVLLSGYSPSLLKMVMYGSALADTEVEVAQADGTTKTQRIRVTPEEVLRKILDDPVYDPVREVVSKSSEGVFFSNNACDENNQESSAFNPCPEEYPVLQPK